MIIHSTTPRGMESTSADNELHRMELEAYGAVLKALTAQGGLTWDLFDTLLDLRKQLRISDAEHKELLLKATTDDSVVMLRQWLERTIAEKALHSNNMNPPLPVSLVTQPSFKRLKTLHDPKSPFPNYPSDTRPLPAKIPSSLAAHFSSQRVGEAAIFSSGEGIVHPKKSVPHKKQASIGGKRMILQSKKGDQLSHINNMKKRLGTNTIEIRATSMLIHEVERLIYSGICPDLVQVEKAKSLLKDQEKAIMEALEKLAEFSDEGDLRQHYDEHQRSGQQLGTHYAFYERVDTMRGYYNPGLNMGHTDERGNTFCQSANYLATP